MLRHCASFSKIAYSARTVPPRLQSEALKEFSGEVRQSLGHLAGDSLPDRSWQLAQLSLINGGLGMRDAERHAGAAFSASVIQSRPLCQLIDPGFDPLDADGGLAWLLTTHKFNECVLDAARVDFSAADRLSQKKLSSLLDASALDSLLQSQRHDLSFRAHVAACSLPGAGAWLTAHPAEDGRDMDGALFRVALKRRLRVQVQQADTSCPCCGYCMDRFGDHALVCQCGGDRTVRHNAIRNCFFADATDAGLNPEKEKAGLLPQRPSEDGLLGTSGARRPADVWLPRGEDGRGEALDFACTSALRADLMEHVASSPSVVFDAYENFKRTHNDTARCCEAQGFSFTPMILEAHGGGWSLSARRVLTRVAKGIAAVWREGDEVASLRIAQRISVSLHRENARAVLKRVARALPESMDTGWGDAVAPSVWQ